MVPLHKPNAQLIANGPTRGTAAAIRPIRSYSGDEQGHEIALASEWVML